MVMRPLMRLLVRLPVYVVIDGRSWEIADIPAATCTWVPHILANQLPEGETWIFYLGATDEETTKLRLYREGFDLPLPSTPPRLLAEQLIREGRAEMLT